MPATLAFGLFDINLGACSEPETASRIARLAEGVGFESLWAGEHVVLPDPREPPSPMEPHDRILDPIIALTFLAAQTHRVRLGTGIIILPQRNPLVLAKEIASLDVLSRGRFIFGIGVGYLEPEFRALGIPFAARGARTGLAESEQIEAGHVAVVERINPDGSVYTANMNWYDGGGWDRVSYWTFRPGPGVLFVWHS